MTDNFDASSINGSACIITGDLLETNNAKTAHGLVRQSDRFEILGIIDSASAGKDAGEVLDGIRRNIPVCQTLDDLIDLKKTTPEYAIIGMATAGGKLPQQLYGLIAHALNLGIKVINGLHEKLNEIEIFSEIVKNNSMAEIYDIRTSRPTEELHFWSGKIREVNCLKIAVLGTDCGLGKRTTTKFLINELTREGSHAHMIYTGQTGWLQGGTYGFILDSTLNDFVSGELEHAVYSCWKKEKPDVIVIEGQSALRNPSGPCGSEHIISCELDGVILHHDPARKYFKGWESVGKEIPSLKEEIQLINLLGTQVIAITLNTSSLSQKEAQLTREKIAKETGLSVFLPLYEGMNSCAKMIQTLIQKTPS